jgi:hypothetical protein
MSQYEDLARLRVNEVIKTGIKAQGFHRELSTSNRKNTYKPLSQRNFRLIFTIVTISLSLAGTIVALNIF